MKIIDLCVLCSIKQLLLVAFCHSKNKRTGSTSMRGYSGGKEQDGNFSRGSRNWHFKERLAMYANCEYCAFIPFAKWVMLCRRRDNFCLRGVIWKMKDCVLHMWSMCQLSEWWGGLYPALEWALSCSSNELTEELKRLRNTWLYERICNMKS